MDKAQEALAPVSVEEEKALGREVAAKLVGYFGALADDALTKYVNEVGATVAAQSERQTVPYRFAVLDSDSINAFSAPGGYVFITRGALALCSNEAELAGVLGHEIGHVAGRHVLKIVERDKAMRAGMSEAGSFAPGSVYLDNLSKNLLIRTINRGLDPGDEYDADQRGVRYAHAAGYPADGLGRFLSKLEKASKEGSRSFWTRTHPPISERNNRIGMIIAMQGWDDSERPRLPERYAAETRIVRTGE
jgi:predicted Zn-dependent protease